MEKTIKKLKLIYPLVVEGKYDKARLASFVETPIIVLNGFSAFNSKDKLDELRVFGKNGLIILTDSDKAGTFIRGKLKALIPQCKMINVFAPVCVGKDNRRNHTNKEGILGVESIASDILYNLLIKYETGIEQKTFLNKQRCFTDGLCGRDNSSHLRQLMCIALNLPLTISSNILMDYINLNLSEDDYVNLLTSLSEDNK